MPRRASGRRSTVRTAPAWSATCVRDRSNCSATPTATRFRARSARAAQLHGRFSLSGYAYGFDIAANFTYSYGNKVFNANNVEFTSSQKYTGKGVIRNLSDVMALGKRWTNVDWTTGNVITDPEALAAANRTTTMWSPYMPQTVVHSWLLEDASFLRLSSLTIGYTLPSSWTRKVRLSKVRFYATGTNLFCWTPYSGFDPEVDTRRATPMTPNVDYSAYTKSRSWYSGSNITSNL